MNKNRNKFLYLFTHKYPYGSEIFLEAELKIISKHFEKIILIPSTKGKKITRFVPENAVIDSTYAEALEKKINTKSIDLLIGFIRLICLRDYYRHIVRKPKRYLHPKGIYSLIRWLITSKRRSHWLKNYLEEGKIDEQNVLLYTYWFNLTTVSLSLAKKRDTLLITRAHGFDLYDERNEYPHVSWKVLALKDLNRVYSISENGKIYLYKNYPEYQEKYRISRLGVFDHSITAYEFDKDIIHILSVSNVITIKRVDMIFKTIVNIVELGKNKSISWHHFGDGRDFDNLKRMIDKKGVTGNLDIVLHGRRPNKEVIDHYIDNNVDFFINLSTYEGIPVSIMEAQSFGVPVIATNVGGVSEIVNDENGILLPENPEPREIAVQILNLLDNPEKYIEKREKSRQNWALKFSAEVNYKSFANELVEL